MKPTDRHHQGPHEFSGGPPPGEPDEPTGAPIDRFVSGVIAIVMRLCAMFVVVGAGYWTLMHLGPDWFRVYIIAALAACLHFELARIDREFPPEDEG